MNGQRSSEWRQDYTNQRQQRRQRQRRRRRHHSRLYCSSGPSSTTIIARAYSSCYVIIILLLCYWHNNNEQGQQVGRHYSVVSSFQATSPSPLRTISFKYIYSNNNGIIRRHCHHQRRRQYQTSLFIRGDENIDNDVNDNAIDIAINNIDDVSTTTTVGNYCPSNFPLSNESSESSFIDYSEDGLCIPAGPWGKAKEQIASFLVEPSVEILIALVVLLNSFLVAVSTLNSLNEYTLIIINNGEIIIGLLFFVDFIARWLSSSRDKFRFIFCPQFVIDILVVILPLIVSLSDAATADGPSMFWEELIYIIPSVLLQPSGLFNLQLLRVLRLRRFLQDLDTFEKFIDQAVGRRYNTSRSNYLVKEWQLQLARVVLSLFTLLSVSSGLIYTAEQAGGNPNINNYFDALYFGLTTLTTVGFGDVSPITWQGRLVVCGSIIIGAGVVPAQAAALIQALLDRENSNNNNTSGGATSASKTNKMRNNNNGNDNGNNNNDELNLALNTQMSCDRCGASFHWSSAQYCYSCGEELTMI